VKFVDVSFDEEPAAAADPSKAPRRSYHTKLAHPGYSIEPCPACGFPEADGASCDECGWFRADNCPYCRKIAR